MSPRVTMAMLCVIDTEAASSVFLLRSPCGTLIGAHYEYLAWENHAVVGKFEAVVDNGIRQLAKELGEAPEWGVHPEISPI